VGDVAAQPWGVGVAGMDASCVVGGRI
jgi:hypothetical protein